MERHPLEVPVAQLRNTCDPSTFDFETTEEIPPLEGTVGQDRGVSAIEFGLQVRTEGYNVFVAGLTGSGRNATVNANLHRVAVAQPGPPDWCYVYNFAEPHRPKAIGLPPGMGPRLAQAMDELIRDCQRDIPKAFESEEYEDKKSHVTRELQAQREAISSELQQIAVQRGFTLQATQMGLVTVPLVEGQPASREQFEALPADEKQRMEAAGEELREEIGQAMARGRKLEKEAAETLRQLDREIALYAVGHRLGDLRQTYREHPKVVEYLQAVQGDMLEHLEDFRGQDKPAEGPQPGMEQHPEDRLARYKVNVFVCNCDGCGAPVFTEHNPTYYNLFGRIDYRARLGTVIADHTTIKPGAIHHANGGYLILQARDLLLSPMAWDALKRTLRSHDVRIENMGEQYSPFPASTLKPEPIPVDVKVILIGHPSLYYLLYHQDEDFRKLFKVKADFGTDMERSEEHVAKYAAFISSRCRAVGLKHFHRSAVAKVVEQGSRQLEHQRKLSTRFIDIADLVDEASFWAEKDGASYVMERHVERAIAEKEYRSNLVEQRLQEMIEDGTIMIGTDGAVVGQINGLSILDMGDYHFGRPSRITARTYLGSSGILNIEREARMSGRLHSKGVMILAAYLGGKYAQERPLSLAASLTFEQLYDDVDGDSASSTELYALLSSLSGLPIKQSLAVTGSVNQRGEIQAIGGVTRKIEGFFAVCKAQGLTGRQGVLVPATNVRNLMLSKEVIAAVSAGQFHIYAARTVDEGIELLTGTPAGEVGPDGTYPPGTVHSLVQQKLTSNAEKLRGYGKGYSKPNKEGEPGKETEET